MDGYTPDVFPKPATKAQLIALRDEMLALGLYSSAAAVDNAIDCIQRDADLAYRLESMRGQFEEYEDGAHPSPVISGGEVMEVESQTGDGTIPIVGNYSPDDPNRPLEDDEFASWHDDPGYY